MALVFFFVASMGVDEAEVPVDAVGKRVSCGGERATVRYFGPVPPTAGRTRVVPLTSSRMDEHHKPRTHRASQYDRKTLIMKCLLRASY